MIPPRILVLSEIPTPYRLPLYERLHARPEIDLRVVFCARSEPDRPWELGSALAAVPHCILPGIAPRLRTRNNTFVYQINFGIFRLLTETRYDALVIGGYAVFAEEAAIAVARARGIPYVLHSESNLLKARGLTKRLLKEVFVRPLITGASAGLATGTASAKYLEHYGMDPNRIRTVPNNIDVEGYRRAADAARANAEDVRRRWNLPERYILYAGRLVEAKGIGEILDALELLGHEAPPLLVAGEGPLARQLPPEPTVRQLGFLQQGDLIELLALAEWTLVPSRVEPWGVVVNEALAAGCPVIASDAVGAAYDLVVNGVNGAIVPAGDPRALAVALTGPRPKGDTSRGKIDAWTYEFGVDQFLDALRLVLPGRLPPK